MPSTSSDASQADVTYATCASCLRLNKIPLAKAQSSQAICGACKTAIDLHAGILNANTQQLKNLIERSPLPVVVDFWAPWCGPCRAFAPAFERTAGDFSGRAVFVKINTEDNMFASQEFGVRGIPTLAVFRGGREVQRQSGAMPLPQFQAWLEQVL